MAKSLAAKVNFRLEDGIWADLEITNKTEEPVKIIQPGNFTPIEGWENSFEAYQVTIFQSFHILKMKVLNVGGIELKQQNRYSPADHAFRLVDLKSGGKLNLPIPLHEFYSLESGTIYTLIIRYGRGVPNVETEASFKG